MIIKELESNDDSIKELHSLLSLNLTANQKNAIKKEIHNLKRGLAGEKNAAFFVNEAFSGSSTVVAHDIRLSGGDCMAQIDHVAINKFGVVFLIETKNFSNDIYIDEEGIFHYFDRQSNSYKPTQSPLEQSKRHERVLAKLFGRIGFEPVSYMHFVLFSYDSKIEKPKKGFDNVCYPDMLASARKKNADNTSNIETLKAFVNLTKNMLNSKKLSNKEALDSLISSFHEPIKVDYRAKFGINKIVPIKTKPGLTVAPTSPIETDKRVDDHVANSDGDKEHLTMAKAAKRLGMLTKNFEALLLERGYLVAHEKGYLKLTDKSKKIGVKLVKGRFGYYFLLPIKFVNSLASELGYQHQG